MHKTETSVSDLRKIPGIGENMQKHLNNIGIHCIADLKGRDPKEQSLWYSSFGSLPFKSTA